MAPHLHPLGDDDVGAGPFSHARFLHRGGGGEPADAARLHRRDEVSRIDSHAAFMVSQRDTFRSKRSPRVASNGGPPDEAVATVGFDQVTVKVQR